VTHIAGFIHSITATWRDVYAMQANVGDEQPVLNEDEDIIEDMGDADMVDQVLYYVAGL